MNKSQNFLQKIKPLYGFSWMVACRYLSFKQKRAFTSVVTVISFLGISIGVCTLIVIMSVMNGFKIELLNKILGINGHIVVYPINKEFENYKYLISYFNSIKGVTLVTPIIEEKVILQGNFGRENGVIVRCLPENNFKKLKNITNFIKSGNIKDFHKGITISSSIAEQLGVSIGDYVNLISTNENFTSLMSKVNIKSYKISIIYEMGIHEYDSSIIFMPLEEGQKFFYKNGKIQFFEILLDNPSNVDKFRNFFEKKFLDNLYVFDWKQRNQPLFSAIQTENNVMFFILSLIILVASLNILSGLVMLVKEKKHDIAIFRTMGTDRISIMLIFFFVGGMIGTIGIFFGVILSLIICYNIEKIQNFISWISSVDSVNQNLYFFNKIPVHIDKIQVFSIIFMSLFVSLLAAIFPAWKASCIDPVKSLRHE